MTTREQGTLSRSATPGPALYSYSAVPDGKSVAVVGVVHGYADYGGRYGHVMDAWADRGIASVAIDMRGHGRARGRRGFCERFGEYLDDARELEHLTAKGGVPAFLFGHSLGGLVAASSAIDRPTPWRALVLSAPFMALAMEVPPLKRIAGQIASRVWPTFSLPSGLSGADVTHDAALARTYDQDPLVFHTATARFFTEVRGAQKRAFDRAPSLVMPLYAVMGTADPIADYRKARAFFDATGSSDKTWDARQGLFHEVLNEPEWRGIADKIADWILARA
jgi:alpha-beta hydrolase superfamily lysophospholipase